MNASQGSHGLVELLSRDKRVRRLLKIAKRVKLDYENLKDEVRTFRVGAVFSRIETAHDFEKASKLAGKAQAYLDRLVSMNSQLNEMDVFLQGLEDEGKAYLNGFDSVARLRNAEIRQAVMSSVLRRIEKKRVQIEDLKDDIEKASWNLKHSFNVISMQCELAKQAIWMRNPEKMMGNRR